MHHSVGGWPKEIDYQEANEVNKYMRKLTKDPLMCFGQATRELVQGATRYIEQNNEIDLFEEYFAGEDPEFMSEPITSSSLSQYPSSSASELEGEQALKGLDPISSSSMSQNPSPSVSTPTGSQGLFGSDPT